MLGLVNDPQASDYKRTDLESGTGPAYVFGLHKYNSERQVASLVAVRITKAA
jgi:hypothetical protein